MALAAGAVYAGIALVPLVVDNWELKRIMKTAANEAWRQTNDEALRMQVLNQSKNVGGHEEIVEGHKQWLPSVNLLAENIFVTRDQDRKEIVIQVVYDREVVLPWLNKKRTIHFSPVVTESTETVEWKEAPKIQ